MSRDPQDLEEPELEADFTNYQPLEPQPCYRCGNPVPYNIWKANAIVDRSNPSRTARHLCPGCFQLYLNKPTTTANRHHTQAKSLPPPSAPSHVNSDLVASIHQNTSSARRPDYGYPNAPVVPLPLHLRPQIPAQQSHRLFTATGQRPAVASNPYASTQPPGASNKHGPRDRVYGYTAEHSHYHGEMQRWARHQHEGTDVKHTFPVIFQLFHLLEHSTLKKRCEPLKNIVETVLVTPSMSGAELAALGRQTIGKVLASREDEFFGFPFDLIKAQVRDPKTWLDIEALSDSFKNGYFFSTVMVPGKQSKKGLANARPTLEFKPPKEAPVLGVVIPFAQYHSYLEWVADVAVEDCKIETAVRPRLQHKKKGRKSSSVKSFEQENSKEGSDTDDSLPEPADILRKRRKIKDSALDTSKRESNTGASQLQKGEPQPQHAHSNNDDADETPDLEITEHIAPPPSPLVHPHPRHSSQSLRSSFNSSDPGRHTLQHQGNPLGRHGFSRPASTRSQSRVQQSASSATAEFERLDPVQFRQAMKFGGSSKIPPTRLASLTSNVAENIIIYPVPTRSVHELLAMSDKEDAGTVSSFWSAFEQLDMYHTTISISVHKFEQGAFKTAHEATLLSESNVLLGHFSGNKIIAKRPYFIENQKFMRYAVTDELSDIGNECNIILWADALLELVYAFMTSVLDEKKTSPPFPTPLLRFTRTGYAYVVAPEGSATATKSSLRALRNRGSVSPSILLGYLLEEKIEGNFVKYIHNGDPSPLLVPTDPEYPVAEFLCFTQHVQYLETGKLAFVSDYQGAGDLLSDPQILTHCDFTVSTFGEGNLAEGFLAFEKKHICNDHCRWYGLAPFDAVEAEGDA